MTAAVNARPSLKPLDLPALPRLWPGFALAGLFVVAEFVEIRFLPPELQPEFTVGPLGVAVALGGFGYWLFCVHRLHRVLGAMAPGGYPISRPRLLIFISSRSLISFGWCTGPMSWRNSFRSKAPFR